MHEQTKTTRRTALALLSAAIGFSSRPAWSGGEGGRQEESGGSSAPLRAPELKANYSQSEFINLSKREIGLMDTNLGRTRYGGKRIRVEGFSLNMSDWLIGMMAFDRPSARRLIRDMAKIKDKAKRKARLQQEVTRIKKRIAKLEASKKRAEDRGSKTAASEARQRLFDANEYLRGVETWAKYPHEGTS